MSDHTKPKSRVGYVPTKTLLLIAAIVWISAGSSVIAVGIHASSAPWTGMMALGSLLTFAAFSTLFLMISRSHVKRILTMAEARSFILSFFNLRSYLIMAFMIALGFTARHLPIVPRPFIAFFYCGLGTALVSAGIYILVGFIRAMRPSGQ